MLCRNQALLFNGCFFYDGGASIADKDADKDDKDADNDDKDADNDDKDAGHGKPLYKTDLKPDAALVQSDFPTFIMEAKQLDKLAHGDWYV